MLLATAITLLAGGLTSFAVPRAAAGAAPPDPAQPLVLRMRSITPDYVPERGPIVIRGTITNASDERWTAINVHGFIGKTPLTTPEAVAEAAQTPVDADVGHRITEPGTFDSIPELDPGQSTAFVVELPRSTLEVTVPGVYWFGVHALGTNAEGRSQNAVGRDRTFVTFVPRSLQTTGSIEDVALLASVRSGVTRGSDGAIQDTAEWRQSLRSGVLHQAVALGRAAQSHPLSWLVDPGVIDAVRQLAAGNPPRSLGTPGAKGGESNGPSASPSPSDSTAPASGAAPVTSPATVRAARGWLTSFRQVLTTGTGQVFGLPYGDLAVDTALAYDGELLAEGVRRTGHSLRPWQVPLTPAVSPPDGRIAADDVSALRRSTELLLDDTAVAGPAPSAGQVSGRAVVFAASAASEGGPGPVDPTSNLALRQRILAEAAVRFLDEQQPLVVRIPEGFQHPMPSFFTGLDVPWLRLTTVDDATAGAADDVDPDTLRAPDPAAPQLGPHVYDAASATLDQGRILQSVIPGNLTLGRTLFTEVSGNASYAAADDRFGALARMETTSRWVTDNLQGIELAAPESVTLASSSGRFSALVSNTLDVPVTVKVRALSDPNLKVTGGETVQLPPHGQTSVLLKAATQVPGVHTVTLELTNQAGQPLGSSDPFPIRAVQVSRLIWVIIGAGLALLFAAIVVRLTRRFLRRGRPSE
jgi:Family of unknown function (DUF6049)